jgi:hypothetical protein
VSGRPQESSMHTAAYRFLAASLPVPYRFLTAYHLRLTPYQLLWPSQENNMNILALIAVYITFMPGTPFPANP